MHENENRQGANPPEHACAKRKRAKPDTDAPNFFRQLGLKPILFLDLAPCSWTWRKAPPRFVASFLGSSLHTNRLMTMRGSS